MMFGGNAKRRPGSPTLSSSFDRAWIALGVRETGDYFAGCGSAPSLRIGLDASLSYGPLRNILNRLRLEAPEVAVRFIEAPAPVIAGHVSEGAIDVAFAQEPSSARRCVCEDLWTEPIMAALPEGHHLSASNSVSREALRKETLLAAADDTTIIAAAGRIATLLGGRPKRIIPAPVHRDTLMNLVGLGYGLALTPSSGLGAFYPGVVYKPIDGSTPHLPVYGIWRPDILEPEGLALLDAARGEGRRGRPR